MQRMKGFLSFAASTAVCLGLAVGFAACSERIDQRGNLPDPDQLANIEIGHINKQGVQQLIGTPSSVGVFDGDTTWYYISERTSKTAFFDPKVLDRKVFVMRFDSKDILQDMKTLDYEDGKDVAMVDRKTPTAGNDFGILRQLFGNFGKFGKKDDSKSPY